MSRTGPDVDAVTELVDEVARAIILPRFRQLSHEDVEPKSTPSDPDDVVTVVDRQVEARLNGSGDQTFFYVNFVFELSSVAFVVSIVWSAAVHARKLSETGLDVVQTLARYYLATTILTYGWGKVFPLQFSTLGPDRLLQTFGDASPMGLAWTFMGASVGYQIFAGLLELAGGYLLFWRRTTLAGALVSAGVLTNVMAFNYFFDVPVKLFSTHLFLVALFIMARDLPQLAGVLGFGSPGRWCIVVLPCPGKARSRLAPHTAGGTQSGDEVEGPSEVQNEVPR